MEDFSQLFALFTQIWDVPFHNNEIIIIMNLPAPRKYMKNIFGSLENIMNIYIYILWVFDIGVTDFFHSLKACLLCLCGFLKGSRAPMQFSVCVTHTRTHTRLSAQVISVAVNNTRVGWGQTVQVQRKQGRGFPISRPAIFNESEEKLTSPKI